MPATCGSAGRGVLRPRLAGIAARIIPGPAPGQPYRRRRDRSGRDRPSRGPGPDPDGQAPTGASDRLPIVPVVLLPIRCRIS